MPEPTFLFITCQVGAEATVKQELARRWPEFRFAYSRPGFLTFKLPAGHGLADDFDLDSVFARAYGFSLGRVSDADEAARIAAVWRLAGDAAYGALHVWPRDQYAVGDHDFEPGLTEDSRAAEAALRAAASQPLPPAVWPTPSSQRVLDVILVDRHEAFVGYHVTRSGTSRWPGGLGDLKLPADAVSRAWLKMEEGLRWSQLPVRAGDVVAELGCSPGGACQALLARGLQVIGVDPAKPHERVLNDKHFTHWQMRGADVRKRDFAGVRWLTADMNVTPQVTLDTVESIVTYQNVNIRGLLLTLKLAQWEMAADLPAQLERIRRWGFTEVRARQLQHNRHEVCVAALR
ncbi:MAG: hypothetical protein JSS27_16115 [Planctomycetes bacterium]|nr:hypothetical protein [Planctomycetota bacterium]